MPPAQSLSQFRFLHLSTIPSQADNIYRYRDLDKYQMSWCNIPNCVTVSKTNRIDEMPLHYGTVWTVPVRIWCPVTWRAVHSCLLLMSSPTDLGRGHRSSSIWLSYMTHILASWRHLHNCWLFQEYPKFLLHSLRALRIFPGGSESIWKYVNPLVRSTRVSGRLTSTNWTNLPFG